MTISILNWKPTNPFAGVLPHRVHLSNWNFDLDSREMVPGRKLGAALLIEAGPQFLNWASEFKIGGFQILYWGENFHRWEAANDEVHTVWSFCFERETDAIFFKMRWV